MSVLVRCPNPACGRTASVAEAHLGRKARCRHCGTAFTCTPPTNGPADALRTMPPHDRDTLAAAAPPTPTLLTSPPASPAPAGPPPGPGQPERVGRFEVRARLGAGAFGAVYRAFDPQLEREVALKVPHPGTLDGPAAAERFLREAKAAARLHHPHIVPVHEVGSDGAHHYIVTTFIEGCTLARAIEERRLDSRQAAKVVRHLAEALAYAHAQGIVHRDVKPANVLLDGHGEAYLMDFGLAHRQDAAQLTQAGAVLGTPAYMAPEQAEGRAGPPLPASDQYSLGVILYELLCGQPPFSGPPQVVLFNVLHREPPAPHAVRPGTPPRLEAICVKAMAKKVEGRYPSMAEFAAALSEYLRREASPAGAPVPSPSATRSATPRPKRKSSPVRPVAAPTLPVAPGWAGRVPRWVWAAGISAALALGVGILGVVLLAVHLPRPKKGPNEANPEAPLAEAEGAVNPTRSRPLLKDSADRGDKEALKGGSGAVKEKATVAWGKAPKEGGPELKRADTGPAPGTKTTPTGDGEVFGPIGPASQERAELGTYVVPRSGPSILVRHPAGGDGWERVPPGARVSSAAPLVSLPGFASELRLDGGVRLLLRGHVREFSLSALQDYLAESAVVLHKPAEGVAADLTLRRGRLYVANGKESGPVVVRLRFEKEAWDLTLREPGTEVGLDLVKSYTRDIKYREGEGPQAELYLCVLSGKAGLKVDTFHYSSLEGPPGPALVMWDNVGPGARGPLRMDAVPPAWSKGPPEFKDDTRRAERARDMVVAIRELSNRMVGGRPIGVALLEGLQADRPATRLLSIYSLGAIDEPRKLLDILGDGDPAHEADRVAAIFTLRRWLGRGAGQGKQLYDEKTRGGLLKEMGYRSNEAAIVFDLLHDFTDAQRRQPETFGLLADYLRTTNRVAIAALAYWQLFHLSGDVKLPPFNAAEPLEQREKIATYVKKLVVEGKLPPRPLQPPR